MSVQVDVVKPIPQSRLSTIETELGSSVDLLGSSLGDSTNRLEGAYGQAGASDTPSSIWDVPGSSLVSSCSIPSSLHSQKNALALPLAAVAACVEDYLGFSADSAKTCSKRCVRFSEDLQESIEITPYNAKYDGLNPKHFVFGPRFEEEEAVTVLVWVASRGQWVPTDGKVIRYLTSPIVSEGPAPPAGQEIPEGAVQVRYLLEGAKPASKWIMPDLIGVEIQKAAPSFSVGDKVRYWSTSRTAWLDAIVQEILVTPEKSLEGVELPVGTHLIGPPRDSSELWSKFIIPQLLGIDLKQMEKTGGRDRRSRSPSLGFACLPKSPPVPQDPCASQGAKPASTTAACFSVGEQVLVWSSSEKTFKQGKILRVLTSSAEPCPQTGKMQRVGSILVRHSKGAKWIPPEFLSREIRKVEPPAATPHDHEASEIQALRLGLEATVAPQRTSVSLPARVPGPVLGEPSNPLEQLRAPFGILDVGEVLSGLTSQLREDSAGLLSFASWTNLRDGWHQ